MKEKKEKKEKEKEKEEAEGEGDKEAEEEEKKEQAKEKEIAVNIDVGVSPNTAIRDIDWVAILANVFENAIHGCSNSGKKDQEIDIYIAKKRNKIIIQCTNTCASDIRFQKGIPKSSSGEGIGTSSIIKTVSRYNGEVDFAIEDGKFVTRILLNLPERGI